MRLRFQARDIGFLLGKVFSRWKVARFELPQSSVLCTSLSLFWLPVGAFMVVGVFAFVGVILVLIFGEALGLFGLIVSLVLSQYRT